MIGLCGQLIANSQENQPMIFLLFVGLISPILASALAAGGGLAVWTGLGKVAAFGGEVAAGIATGGASTAATVAVNATKFVASKVKK